MVKSDGSLPQHIVDSILADLAELAEMAMSPSGLSPGQVKELGEHHNSLGALIALHQFKALRDKQPSGADYGR